MKGATKLSSIQSNNDDITPENIDWWVRIEEKYQRDLKAEGREISTEENPFINFFGVGKKLSYSIIKDGSGLEANDDSLPCNCTD